jgi:uncharacterized membrane protein
MTGTEIALIIGNIATLVTAIGGFVVLFRKTEVIHKATNSLTDRLVAVTKTESFAAGVKSETDKQ